MMMVVVCVGAEELDLDGCGLNVRDAVMEKIFVVDTATQEANKVRPMIFRHIWNYL